ncbi:hypothetical protein Fot_22554 [Forsythia ovata]|uniref:RNase H type-1 domain-containing protein n=1 Tax=Forsythia ovata TaxID=205694 RepID=A0ABD1V003_9LAMI
MGRFEICNGPRSGYTIVVATVRNPNAHATKWAIIHGMRKLMSNFHRLTCKLTRQDANCAAHALAKHIPDERKQEYERLFVFNPIREDQSSMPIFTRIEETGMSEMNNLLMYSKMYKMMTLYAHQSSGMCMMSLSRSSFIVPYSTSCTFTQELSLLQTRKYDEINTSTNGKTDE